jgi:hypothetical protein
MTLSGDIQCLLASKKQYEQWFQTMFTNNTRLPNEYRLWSDNHKKKVRDELKALQYGFEYMEKHSVYGDTIKTWKIFWTNPTQEEYMSASDDQLMITANYLAGITSRNGRKNKRADVIYVAIWRCMIHYVAKVLKLSSERELFNGDPPYGEIVRPVIEQAFRDLKLEKLERG